MAIIEFKTLSGFQPIEANLIIALKYTDNPDVCVVVLEDGENFQALESVDSAWNRVQRVCDG